MRKHYISLDEVDITDKVMNAIQGRSGEDSDSQTGTEPTDGKEARCTKSMEIGGPGAPKGNDRPKSGRKSMEK